MKINRTTHRTRNALVAGLTAGAAFAGAFGMAAPANAATDYYIGLSYSFESHVAGRAMNQLNQTDAQIRSLSNCQDSGGNHCVLYALEKNTCVALAVKDPEQWRTATGSTAAAAQQAAMAQLPGSQIATSGCANSKFPNRFPGRIPTGPLTQVG